ncbi:hypothetical protein N9Q25_00470 [bacterium]|nr:hypothetical protein [bacterium]
MSNTDKEFINDDDAQSVSIFDFLLHINNSNTEEQYVRTEINKLDTQCNLVLEHIEDKYLQDDDQWSELFDVINEMQEKITELQESKQWI